MSADDNARELALVQTGNRARLDQLAADRFAPNPVRLLKVRQALIEDLLLGEDPAERTRFELAYEQRLVGVLEELLAVARERRRIAANG